MTGDASAQTCPHEHDHIDEELDHLIEIGWALGPEVFPLALGCMGMGAGSLYGTSDEAEAIATIHAALERGVNLIDTGDFYAMGKNELLVGKALAGGRRDKALLSVKFGALRGPDGAFLGYDARPAATKNFLAHSLSRLGVDHIDIYRPARLDPAVPIEDTIGAIADMVKAGYVRYIGLSEVGAETIRRAAKVHPICDLQIEYSLRQPRPGGDDLPRARRARHRDDRVRRALARPAHRQQADRRGRLSRASAAFLRRQRREEPRAGALLGAPRCRQGRQAGAARHRLGPRQGRGPEA